MAPPRHRDRGFSRRIQYGLFFGYVAAVAGIVAGLALILIARFDPLAFEGIRGLAIDITAPFSGAGRNVVRGAGQVGGDFGGYFGAVSENRRLKGEIADLRREIVAARASEMDNKRLRRLLAVIDPAAKPVAVARIVGSSLVGDRRYATLAAGSADGVRAGMPVRGPEGLIGRVAETGAHAARVLLVTDGGSSVPLRVARTGEAAIGEGRGDGTLDLRATTLGAQPFRRGDLLITSGVGGVYPPGLPVAVVVAASGEVGSGRPLSDPATLDFAVVLPEVAIAPPPPAPIGAAH
jgi:rod shape-determining protein MreC